jgi:hypothetical protein
MSIDRSNYGPPDYDYDTYTCHNCGIYYYSTCSGQGFMYKYPNDYIETHMICPRCYDNPNWMEQIQSTPQSSMEYIIAEIKKKHELVQKKNMKIR